MLIIIYSSTIEDCGVTFVSPRYMFFMISESSWSIAIPQNTNQALLRTAQKTLAYFFVLQKNTMDINNFLKPIQKIESLNQK